MIYFSDFSAANTAPAYFTAEALGPTSVPASTGGTTYYDSASLTVTAAQQQANATYLGIWSTDNTTDNTNAANNRLNKDSGTIIATQAIRLKDGTPQDRHTFGGIFFHNAGSSPSDVNYKIQHSKVTSGTTNSYNSRVSLLKLGANDVTSEDLTGPGSLTNTTFTTVDSLSLTGGPYDWVVLAYLDCNGSNSTFRFRLTDGTTSIGDIKPSTKGSFSEVIPVHAALLLTGVTNATVNFDTRTTSASFAYTPSGIRMVALRLDRFTGATVANLGSANAGTDTTYTAAHSQTFTPAAVDYLTLAFGTLAANSNTISVQGRFMDGGTEVSQFTREAIASGDAYPFFTHRIVSMAASSRTQSIDRLSETASVTATLNANAFIASIRLDGL